MVQTMVRKTKRFFYPFMVYTYFIQEQYAFIYAALLEYITCGNTSIGGPVKSAIVRIDELFTVNPSAEKSELQLQFEV